MRTFGISQLLVERIEHPRELLSRLRNRLTHGGIPWIIGLVALWLIALWLIALRLVALWLVALWLVALIGFLGHRRGESCKFVGLLSQTLLGLIQGGQGGFCIRGSLRLW